MESSMTEDVPLVGQIIIPLLEELLGSFVNQVVVIPTIYLIIM